MEGAREEFGYSTKIKERFQCNIFCITYLQLDALIEVVLDKVLVEPARLFQANTIRGQLKGNYCEADRRNSLFIQKIKL